MLPLVKWSGGKQDEIKNFEHLIPKDFNVYLEPFAGGASVFFYLEPKSSAINDIHPELIDFYKSIRDGFGKDIHDFMEMYPNDEDTYYFVRSLKCKNQLENAMKFYYLRKTCYRGMLRYNSNGEFNIPFGRYKSINYSELLNNKYIDLFKECEIYNTDFSLLFEKYNDQNNFMFLDPPYDSTFTDYGYCVFGKDEHIRLSEYFKTTKIRCLMVIGETDFIKELYKGYIHSSFSKNYRFKLHSDRVNVSNNHLIIKNY